ncbi:MAG: hypothetical protein ABSG83_18740 [Roseiarcus sp.]|jgi:hypothetical protein
MDKSKVIVEAGTEGGSIALHGLQAGQGWKFSLEVFDWTPALLDEDPIHANSAIVDTWAAGLELLDKYRWARFHPVFVDPDFKPRVWEAVKERLMEDGEASQSRRNHPLERWREVCGSGD